MWQKKDRGGVRQGKDNEGMEGNGRREGLRKEGKNSVNGCGRKTRVSEWECEEGKRKPR